MGLPYEVGDIVTLKKVHPCGSRDWEILRVGADFRLKCTGCGHQIMVPRKISQSLLPQGWTFFNVTISPTS